MILKETLSNAFQKRLEYLAISSFEIFPKVFYHSIVFRLMVLVTALFKEFRTLSWIRCYHCAMVRPLTQSVLFGSSCTYDHYPQHKLQIHRLCSVYDQCAHTKCKCLLKQSRNVVGKVIEILSVEISERGTF